MPFNTPSLVTANERALSGSGYSAVLVALYQNPARVAQALSYDPVAETFSTDSSITVATGKRVNLFGTLPSNYTLSTYFMISLGPGVFQLATSLANAQATIAITPSSPPVGATIIDADIDATDSVDSLVTYEIAGLDRPSVTFSTSVYNLAADAAVSVTDPVIFSNTSVADVNVSHVLMLMGGFSSPGSTSNDYYALETVAGTIAIGGTLTVVAQHRAKSEAV